MSWKTTRGESVDVPSHSNQEGSIRTWHC